MEWAKRYWQNVGWVKTEWNEDKEVINKRVKKHLPKIIPGNNSHFTLKIYFWF